MFKRLSLRYRQNLKLIKARWKLEIHEFFAGFLMFRRRILECAAVQRVIFGFRSGAQEQTLFFEF